MPTCQRASSGSPLEDEIGFSRAVRNGSIVAIAGTAPIGADGKTVGVGDIYAQMSRCLDIAETALTDVGASVNDVVRTRVMMTDVANWRDAARAHGERFASIKPATTFVQVSGFLDPQWLVEIELDAIIGGLDTK